MVGAGGGGRYLPAGQAIVRGMRLELWRDVYVSRACHAR